MSDYAAVKKYTSPAKLHRAQQYAMAQVKKKRASALLPETVWHEVLDAQRFLSLYTPESAEEIFCYESKTKVPTRLRRVRVPLLVVLAERDEYRDRPIAAIASWFAEHLSDRDAVVQLVPNATHSLADYENLVSRRVREWVGA